MYGPQPEAEAASSIACISHCLSTCTSISIQYQAAMFRVGCMQDRVKYLRDCAVPTAACIVTNTTRIYALNPMLSSKTSAILHIGQQGMAFAGGAAWELGNAHARLQRPTPVCRQQPNRAGPAANHTHIIVSTNVSVNHLLAEHRTLLAITRGSASAPEETCRYAVCRPCSLRTD
jgi:hypothetical protein